MTANQSSIIKIATQKFVDCTEFKLSDLLAIADENHIPRSEVYRLVKTAPRVKRGIYNLQSAVLPFRKLDPIESKSQMLSVSVQSIVNEDIFVPTKDQYFIPWGNYKDVELIVSSNAFYPVYIAGLSGNGKTMMVEQACSKADRAYIRVQITPETDEDDLIGGFRLINGETVFAKGPVIKAMESGALLLIDEIDRGSNKIMCLQGVLEGKPVMIKKTGEVITPAPGFNIIATANTKGKGSEDGRFIAATIIDEAFLERFTITIEQPYPSATIEKRIILKHMEKYDCKDTDFAEILSVWSDTIRKTFEDGGLDELVSTRRLCHIVQTFSIFKDRKKAIELCVSRFDSDTKEAFVDLYTKVDASVAESEPVQTQEDVLNAIDNIIESETV
jgi:MoxR-like ATPase